MSLPIYLQSYKVFTSINLSTIYHDILKYASCGEISKVIRLSCLYQYARIYHNNRNENQKWGSSKRLAYGIKYYIENDIQAKWNLESNITLQRSTDDIVVKNVSIVIAVLTGRINIDIPETLLDMSPYFACSQIIHMIFFLSRYYANLSLGLKDQLLKEDMINYINSDSRIDRLSNRIFEFVSKL